MVRRAQPVCPYCNRVMSFRENDEQGACNDCYQNSGHQIPGQLDLWTENLEPGDCVACGYRLGANWNLCDACAEYADNR